jgi:hypothetical protein
MHELRSTILSGEEKPSSPVARKGKAKAAASGAADLAGLTAIRIKREEARITNQRLEDRHRGVVEECGIVFRRKKMSVPVINVSSRGAMIVAEIEPRIGERIDIQFTDQAKTRCVVRWVREGRIGLEFAEETIFWDTSKPAGPVLRIEETREEAPAAEQATALREVHDREPRQTLLRTGTLYWSGITIPVRLRNISSTGAKIESNQQLRPGTEVELDLGESGFQVAEVRWAKDGQVGLRFASEFDLDSLAPRERPASSPATELLKPAYLETETQPDSPWAARFERLSLKELRSKLIGGGD